MPICYRGTASDGCVIAKAPQGSALVVLLGFFEFGARKAFAGWGGITIPLGVVSCVAESDQTRPRARLVDLG